MFFVKHFNIFNALTYSFDLCLPLTISFRLNLDTFWYFFASSSTTRFYFFKKLNPIFEIIKSFPTIITFEMKDWRIKVFFPSVNFTTSSNYSLKSTSNVFLWDKFLPLLLIKPNHLSCWFMKASICFLPWP